MLDKTEKTNDERIDDAMLAASVAGAAIQLPEDLRQAVKDYVAANSTSYKGVSLLVGVQSKISPVKDYSSQADVVENKLIVTTAGRRPTSEFISALKAALVATKSRHTGAAFAGSVWAATPAA